MKKALPLLISVLLICSAHAGPTYNWSGTGTSSMGIVEPGTAWPPAIDYLPVPYASSVVLTYQPDPNATLISTKGDTSAFQAQFSLSIAGGGPGFTSGSLTGQQYGVASIFVTVPATGLDRIDFMAVGNPDYTGRGPSGSIEVWAPQGTLTTSTVLPLSLDAFQSYALTNPGGYFQYSPPAVPGSSGATQWAGVASGTLGDPPSSVPEPSTFALMALGMILILIRQRR